MRVLAPGETLRGERVSLRLLVLDDCSARYLGWLEDPEVNRYLETRWRTQTLEAIREFVASKLASDDSYLFAILENTSSEHIGNIKIGPVHPIHSFADVSYFIGERRAWGKGYATEAIQLVTHFGFERLRLHRVQAGVYRTNVGSIRALEKAGYTYEGFFANQLRTSSDVTADA